MLPLGSVSRTLLLASPNGQPTSLDGITRTVLTMMHLLQYGEKLFQKARGRSQPCVVPQRRKANPLIRFNNLTDKELSPLIPAHTRPQIRACANGLKFKLVALRKQCKRICDGGKLFSVSRPSYQSMLIPVL